MPFDPNEILNQQSTEAFSTQHDACPEGEFQSIITKTNIREFKYKAEDRKGQTGYSLDVTFTVLDPQIEAALGRQPTVRGSYLLDITPTGGLDGGKGKNIGLGILREAVSQNAPGMPWNMRMLEGQQLVIKVKHRIEGDRIYADVDRVRKAA